MPDQATAASEPQLQDESHSTTPPITPETEITITVSCSDEPTRTFEISKSLLTKYDYFRASLNPCYESSTTNELILNGKEHPSNDVAKILGWIKGDRKMLRFEPNLEVNHDHQVRWKQEELARMYIQAHKFLLCRLQNEIVDAVRDFSQTALPSLDAWCALKNQISGECGLAKYLMDNLVWCLIITPGARQYSPDHWHVHAANAFGREQELERLVDRKISERKAKPTGNHFAPGGTFQDMRRYYDPDGDAAPYPGT